MSVCSMWARNGLADFGNVGNDGRLFLLNTEEFTRRTLDFCACSEIKNLMLRIRYDKRLV
jgi:hypothetical protein